MSAFDVGAHAVTSGADTITVPDVLSVRAAVLRIGRTCAYELAQQYVHTGGEAGLKVTPTSQ